MARAAEALVCEHLRKAGYEVLGRNVHVGRLELDVIARRGELIAFCEVRARRSDAVMFPTQSIGPDKARRVRRAGATWLRSSGLSNLRTRFDAASVVFDQPGGRLTYLEGAF
jgi:putative endonuclease